MQWHYLLFLNTLATCYPKMPCVTSDGTCPDDLECAISEPEDCNEGHFKQNVTDCRNSLHILQTIFSGQYFEVKHF